MNLLILKGFNNYFNRIIKRYTTLSDYITNSDAYYEFSDINFNPNDGVTTTQVIGSTTQQQTGGPDPVPLAWEHDGNPDYIIAYETQKVDNTTINTIKSRWFIVESVRTRNGQYSLKLKRDSIADHLDTLSSCPAFIKKGTVSDDNPLILNDEGIAVNQIKSAETLLKDKTGSAWLVGYMPKNGGVDGQVTLTIPTKTVEYETIENIASELGVSADDLSNALTTNSNNTTYFVNDNIEIIMWTDVYWGTNQKLIAGSQNFLNSFTYGSRDVNSAHSDSDCPIYAERIYVAGTFAMLYHKLWYEAVNTIRNQIKSNWSTYTSHPFFTKNTYNKLIDLENNKTIIYKNGKYYRIKHSNDVISPSGYNYHGSATSAPFSTAISTFVNNWNNTSGVNAAFKYEIKNRGNVYIYYNELKSNFYLEEVSTSSDIEGISFSMSSTRNACIDQVFDMFAIPFSNIEIVNGLDVYEGIGDYAQELAVAIAEKMSAGSYDLYDLQLLPYCPIPEIAGDGNIDISALSSGYDYDFITQTNADLTYVSEQYLPVIYSLPLYEVEVTLDKPSGTGTLTTSDITILWSTEYHENESLTIVTQSSLSIKLSLMFKATGSLSQIPKVQFSWEYESPDPIIRSVVIYPKNATFSANIATSLSLTDSMKIEALCNNYRLVSPNYQGSFDFNVAKNGGSCSGFIAECTYKPYTPYIKVAPAFSWMYGTNYGDVRGLVCNGDFSLGRVNSAWESYQLQNKNFQNIFNREIQNLDINQSIQRTQQYVSGGLNIVRDTISGGVGGALATGSPYGAIAGAAVGGIGSGIGYGVDMSLMEKSLQEQRQFSIDKYRMQLGNIQAIPYTITKVSSFDINSKIWPFLEFYTCTDTEKEALRMKIQYEGMTVGIVDYLGNYMNGGYVQADLIRNEAIIEDSHQLDDIYIELTKGVYM